MASSRLVIAGARVAGSRHRGAASLLGLTLLLVAISAQAAGPTSSASHPRLPPTPPAPVLPVPAKSSGLPFWTAPRPQCDKPLCGYELIPNATSAPVYLGSEAGGWYNHAAMITIHRDAESPTGFVITVSWKNAPVSEDTPGQRVLLTRTTRHRAFDDDDGTVLSGGTSNANGVGGERIGTFCSCWQAP